MNKTYKVIYNRTRCMIKSYPNLPKAVPNQKPQKC